MNPGPKVVISDLSLSLGGTQILSDVSHVFEAGRLHCMLGPNGGGKTSLMRCILGQMPFLGSIRFEDGTAGPIGYMPQAIDFDRSLPLTVDDILSVMIERRPAFFRRSARTRAAIDEALARVGMENMGGRRFGALSGGERQRVLFAQALVPEPALVLLDEPTSSLDEAGNQQIEALALTLVREGKTVIWVIHNWAQARRVADSVLCINGTVTLAGAPAEAIPAVPLEVPA